MQEYYQQLKEFGHVRLNEPLSKHTTFKIGGPADFFIEVNEVAKLTKLLNFLNSEGISWFVLGGGSNILFKDENFEGVVIKIKTTDHRLTLGLSSDRKQTMDTIIADSGVLLSQIVNLAVQNNLSGMEWGVGIPGTVGGAVRGNAGAMGYDTSRVVEKVEVWRDGEVLILNNNECGFFYRGSDFKKNGGVILRAWFKLVPGEKQSIVNEVGRFLQQRQGRYPTFPSAGSFFQNIDIDKWPGDTKNLPEIFVERKKIPVGWLVEQCNLKGYTVGGAKVSDEHGNFVVNFKEATQAEILAVVETVQEKVYNKFGVELKPEVEIIK